MGRNKWVSFSDEYKMEFSVEVFRQKPSYDILGLCRKNFNTKLHFIFLSPTQEKTANQND